MWIRTWLLAAVLVPAMLAPVPAAAEIVLSEAEALARLSSDSPRVRAIRATLEIARADVIEAGRWPNPRFVFNRESVAGTTEDMVSLTQPLPMTGRRGLDVRAASTRVEAASRRVDDEIRRARGDLRLAFAALVAAQTRETELASAGDRLRALTAILARREAAGDAAGFDRLRADREVIDVEADRAAAAADRALAQAALAGFFAGAVDPTQLVAARTPGPRPVLPALDELVARAETVRGDLQAFDHEIEAARLSARAAGRLRVPEPEILAGTKASSAAGGDMGAVFAVQAVLPLFDRGQAQRALARAREASAEARRETFRQSLRYQIAALREVVLERRAAADGYRAAVAGGADEIERIAQVSYEAGERGIFELLDAYRTTASARIRQALLDAAARAAEIELEFASGWEVPS
jgi:cobalt-zinc-cadmium efflux system outer membrane protein